MMKFEINSKCIHDEYFFTFETSWMGEVSINFEDSYALIPLLNLDVENKSVLDFFNLSQKNGRIFIERSYLNFIGVKSICKELAIHNLKLDDFLNRIREETILEKSANKLNQFEFGSFGIYQNYTYDGVIKIVCDKCYYVLPDNVQYRFDFKSQGEYLPFDKSTLDFLSNKK